MDVTSNNYYLWSFDIPNNITEGVIVYSIEDGSPASEAKIKKGDIITKLNDEKITSLAQFRYELYKHKAGEEINISIIRDEKEMNIKVKLGTSK